MSADAYAGKSGISPEFDEIDGLEDRWPVQATVFYALMCTVTVLNFLVYGVKRAIAESDRREWLPKYRGYGVEAPLAAYFRKQHALGAVVIVISALRALFPTQLAERFAWYEGAVCSVLVHRALQAVLELCLVALLVSALSVVNRQVFYLRSRPHLNAAFDLDGSGFPPGGVGMYRCTQVATIVAVGLVVGAQVNAFLGTLTASSQWYAYAEVCWGLGLLVLLPSVGYLYSHAATYRESSSYEQSGTSTATLLAAESVIVVFYLIWLTKDVPDWWSRVLEEDKHSVPAVSWEESFKYALDFRLVTHSWNVWCRPAAWETIYRIVINVKAIFLAAGPHLAGVPLDGFQPESDREDERHAEREEAAAHHHERVF